MKRILYLLFVVVCLLAASLPSWATPTVQASYITFRTVTSTSMDITFSRGNGYGRIVVVSPTGFPGTGSGNIPINGVS
jgi:hypothetical protein